MSRAKLGSPNLGVMTQIRAQLVSGVRLGSPIGSWATQLWPIYASNNFSTRAVSKKFNWRKWSFFIQINSFETRIIYIDQENIGLSVFRSISYWYNCNSFSLKQAWWNAGRNQFEKQHQLHPTHPNPATQRVPKKSRLGTKPSHDQLKRPSSGCYARNTRLAEKNSYGDREGRKVARGSDSAEARHRDRVK